MACKDQAGWSWKRTNEHAHGRDWHRTGSDWHRTGNMHTAETGTEDGE